MPAALSVNKELMRDLYLQGVRPEIIAKQNGVKVGTLHQWISKEKWSIGLSQLQGKLIEMAHRPLAIKLQEQSNKVRTLLADDMVKSAQNLPAHTRNREGFKERQLGVRALTQNSAVVFGWSEDDGKQVVNVAILSALGKTNALPQSTSPVIDVPTTDVEKAKDKGNK